MRRPFLLFYVLVFLDEVALLAIVPLLPAYTRAYHLSDVEPARCSRPPASRSSSRRSRRGG